MKAHASSLVPSLHRAYERNGDTGGELDGRYVATVMAGLSAAKRERRVGAFVSCPPLCEPHQADGNPGRDVLQVGLGEAKIAGVVQAAAPDGLRMGGLDPSPCGVASAKRRCDLLFSSRQERLVLLTGLQPDDPRFPLGSGAAGAERTRRAVLAREPPLPTCRRLRSSAAVREIEAASCSE
jgi:hypothetical protein